MIGGFVGYGGIGKMMCWGHMDVGGVVDGLHFVCGTGFSRGVVVGCMAC